MAVNLGTAKFIPVADELYPLGFARSAIQLKLCVNFVASQCPPQFAPTYRFRDFVPKYVVNVVLHLIVLSQSVKLHIFLALGEVQAVASRQHLAHLLVAESVVFVAYPTTVDNGAVMMRLDNTLFSYGGYIEVSNFIITAGDKEAEWVEAPEDAFTDAAKAQADANAAKARLDRWADDGVISPTEKPGLKDEIRRIGSDYSEIGSRYENYQSHIEDDTELAKLYGAWDSYDLAYMAYSNMLIELSADSPETIAIPADFKGTQSAYYLARAEILQFSLLPTTRT